MDWILSKKREIKCEKKSRYSLSFLKFYFYRVLRAHELVWAVLVVYIEGLTDDHLKNVLS